MNRRQKWEENNFMDILSDKQATPHTRKRGRGLERENIREKLTLF